MFYQRIMKQVHNEKGFNQKNQRKGGS